MSLKSIKSYFADGVVNQSLKVLLLRVIGVFLFFGLSLFLTNYFDAELVGKYDFTRSWLVVVGGFCMLGTNQAIIYYSGVLASKKSIGSLLIIYRRMVFIILITTFVFTGMFFLIPSELISSFFNKQDAAVLIRNLVLTLFVYAISLLNIDTLRAQGQTLFSEVYRNIFRYLPFFLISIWLYFNSHTKYLVLAFLLSFVLLAVASSIQVRLGFSQMKKQKAEYKISVLQILKHSYPMALSAVSYFLMQSVDIILLGKFVSFEQVAYYSVAVKLATAASLALISVNIIIAPMIAQHFEENNKAELRKVVRTAARLIFILSIPVLLILLFFPSFTLSLFGESYKIARMALIILLLGQVFNTLCGPVGIYLNMTGKQKGLQIILAIGLSINVGLNFVLIPLYGLIGAASATALSMVIWNLLAVYYAFKKDRINTFIS